MIKILPSITILNGKCAKFSPDKNNDALTYTVPPLEMAQLFEEKGFGLLHIVDLDSVKAKTVVNHLLINEIAQYTDLEINFSGGLRTDGGAQIAFEYGADTITVGTLAVNERERVSSWLVSFKRSKVVIAADVNNGFMTVEGWHKKTETELYEFLDYYQERGALFIKLTDVARDGILEGPNFELYKTVCKRYPDFNILASGGVRSIDDVKKLQDLGVYGAIIARAIYENKIDLDELAKFATR
jgi:phosphoribosylformimino-5-aminoimidazole carboxamide ribotide isomerase